MKKSILILAILLIPSGAKAQFGFAQTVVLVKMLAQDVLIYGSSKGTQSNTGDIKQKTAKGLELAIQMSQPISTLKYQGLHGLLWQLPYLLNPDRYGHALPWLKAASGQVPATIAYQLATVPVPPGDWPAYYASASPAQQNRIASEYAWVQDADAENAAALGAIGDSNRAIPSGQVAINNLASDNFAMGFASTNPQLSQIALAQKQGIGTTMGVQVEIQNQQLLAHILHQLILMNTRTRNEEAKRLNSDQLIHTQTAQGMQGASGLAAAMNSVHY